MNPELVYLLIGVCVGLIAADFWNFCSRYDEKTER